MADWDGPHVHGTARIAANLDLLPGVSRNRRHAMARWVVDTRLAESTTSPTLIHALAITGMARAATLADSWLAAPAY